MVTMLFLRNFKSALLKCNWNCFSKFMKYPSQSVGKILLFLFRLIERNYTDEKLVAGVILVDLLKAFEYTPPPINNKIHTRSVTHETLISLYFYHNTVNDFLIFLSRVSLLMLYYYNVCSGVFRTFTPQKVSVFGVILVHIFPHSNWIRRDTSYLSVFSPNAGK